MYVYILIDTNMQIINIVIINNNKNCQELVLD